MNKFVARAGTIKIKASAEDLDNLFAQTVESIKRALPGSKSTLLPISARSTGSRPVIITTNTFVLDVSHITKIKKAIDDPSLDSKWDLKGQAVDGGYPTAIHDYTALIYAGEAGEQYGEQYVEVATVSAIGAVYVTRNAG